MATSGWYITWYYGDNYLSCKSFDFIARSPSFSSLTVRKSGRGPGIFSHMSDVGGRKDGRRGLIVRGHKGSRTVRRTSIPGNLRHVSSYRGVTAIPKHWGCSQLNNMWSCACLFWPFSDYVMLTWEKISGSPRFSVLQAMESWSGPGNESSLVPLNYDHCLIDLIGKLWLIGVRSTHTYW